MKKWKIKKGVDMRMDRCESIDVKVIMDKCESLKVEIEDEIWGIENTKNVEMLGSS